MAVYLEGMSNVFTSRPEASRRGYHHGNLREGLIDAARFLIAERGPQGFTLIEAARLVDVSPAAPYRHFKDRDALVAAVSERGFGLFAERLEQAYRAPGREAAGSDHAMARLQALGSAYLAFAREEPGFYGAMFLAAKSAGPTGNASFGLLADAVRQAVGGSEAAPGAAEATAMQIWALAHGVAVLQATCQWPTTAGAPDPETVLRTGTAAIIAATAGQRKVS